MAPATLYREPPRPAVPTRETVPVSPGAFPRLEEEPHATSEAAPGNAHPWPELPPAPATEREDVLVELRQWERLRRLEREQRGE